jgi:hypothetical protein
MAALEAVLGFAEAPKDSKSRVTFALTMCQDTQQAFVGWEIPRHGIELQAD